MRIALFKHISLDFTRIMDEDLAKYRSNNDVQSSEWVDVEFKPLPAGDIIAKQIAGLDKIKEEVVADYTKKLADIDRRKAELLALPNLETV